LDSTTILQVNSQNNQNYNLNYPAETGLFLYNHFIQPSLKGKGNSLKGEGPPLEFTSTTTYVASSFAKLSKQTSKKLRKKPKEKFVPRSQKLMRVPVPPLIIQ